MVTIGGPPTFGHHGETTPSEFYQRFTVFEAFHLWLHLGGCQFEDGEQLTTSQPLPFFTCIKLTGTQGRASQNRAKTDSKS